MKRRDLFRLLPGLPVVILPTPAPVPINPDPLAISKLKTAEANVEFWANAVTRNKSRKDRGDDHILEFANVNWAAAKERLARLQ